MKKKRRKNGGKEKHISVPQNNHQAACQPVFVIFLSNEQNRTLLLFATFIFHLQKKKLPNPMKKNK
jgi:hypothetical protein